MTVYLVRHGETVANRAGRWLGHSDSPLTDRGVAQSLAFAEELAGLLPDRAAVELQCSPLARARRTAGLIADRLALDPGQCRISPLLAEHAFGRWEGLTEAEIEARFPGAQAERHRAHWTYVVPGGESYEQVFRRACRWIDTPRSSPVTVAVTHAKTSRTLRGAYLGLDPASILAFKHPQDRVFALRDGEIATILCPVPDDGPLGTGPSPADHAHGDQTRMNTSGSANSALVSTLTRVIDVS